MSNVFDTFSNPFDRFDDPARARAVGGTAASPDAAAKSIDLSKQTNTPFELVNTDPAVAAEQLRAKEASEAADHPTISKYINSYPPAAEVSNDDYPNLARVADAVKFKPGIINAPENFLNMIRVPGWGSKLWEAVKEYPEHFLKGMQHLIETPGEVLRGKQLTPEEQVEFGAGLGMMLAFGRPFRAGTKYDFGPGVQARTVNEFLAEAVDGTRGTTIRSQIDEFLRARAEGKSPAEAEAAAGISPKEAADVVQAHTDAIVLDNAMEIAGQSKTLKRSPDAFVEFVRSATDQTISIPATALAKLYETNPESVSWIPDLQNKIDFGLETGGDVEIPLADYLARGQDIHEGVRDNVRTQSGGLTINEVKELKPEAPETLPTEPLQAAAVQEQRDIGLRALFQDAKAAGMTEAQFNAYNKKIQGQVQAIEDRATTIAEREVKKRQTAEWKANEAKERAEVEQEISQNPLHIADRELRADKRLGNVDPDILAPIFGFNSGEAMIRNLELLNNARNKAKQTPAQYLKDLISRETARRMETKYGDLQENIFNEARDLALADLHIDLMDTELRALVEQAKGEPPLSKEELRDWVRQNHSEADVKSGSQFDRFQRQAWKASREAEQALLKGNYIDAAKAKQRQLLSFMLAQEAQKLQKELRAADKLFSRFESREVANVDQIFTDRIHQILNMIEWPLKRDPAEIEAIAKKSLEDFVAEQEGNFREVPVAEFLLDGNFRGPLDTLSVDQFRAINDSIRTLAHNGREVKTITTAAAKAELEDVVGRAVDSLSRFNPVNQPLNKNPIQKTSAVARWILAEHMLPERILDITDKFDVHGPFNEFVDRPLRESLNKEFQITEEVTKRLRALRDDDTKLYSRIENDLIPDTYDKSGFMNLNRLNLRMIMLNMGNVGKKSNMRKLTEGFGVEEGALRDFINRHATKADWEWVNGMWDVFKYLKSEADQMYERLTGIAPTSIKATPIDTPFGQYPGGYAPIIYDPMRARIGEARVRESLLEEPGYYRATTPNSYTKERTGATGALDISGVNLDRKIWQMAHDIAFREAIIGAGKVLTNGEVKAAITKFWGKEYADQFVPWLKDIANMRNSDDFPASTAAYWSSVIRQNVVSALVTINPGTITKHGLSAFGLSVAEVGPKNFLSALGDMTSTLGKADSQWQFVMDTSPFMRNRMQKYVESIRGAYAEATGKGIDITRPTTWRHPIMYYGRSPIMLFDSLSAVPTWIAAYKKAVEAGETAETATFAADKAVSRAHGSASVIDKPHVQRVDSEPMKWFTALYNFFNHIFNKQVELVWDTKSAGAKLLRGEARTPNEAAASLTGRMMAHVIWPIVVEEWVTSWFDDTEQKRGLGQRISMAMIRHLGAGIVGLREITHAWTSGGPKGPLHEPSTGMIGAMLKVGTQTADDAIRKLWKDKEPSKDWITHLGTSLGMLTGVGGAAPSKIIQFGQKVATGQENPQTPYQVLKGLRKGSMRERRH